MTVVKVIDPPSGVTLDWAFGNSFFFDTTPREGTIALVEGCSRFESSGTKRVIAFYRPGERDLRAECTGYGNLISDRCMPKPGDIVAEDLVEIVNNQPTTVRLVMEPEPRR